MSCFSVDPGHKTYQHTTSSAPQGQLQRQTLLVTGGHKRCPSVPASRERALTIPVQYTMPFYPDFRPQPEMKGNKGLFISYRQLFDHTDDLFIISHRKIPYFRHYAEEVSRLTTSHDSKLHFTVLYIYTHTQQFVLVLESD